MSTLRWSLICALALLWAGGTQAALLESGTPQQFNALTQGSPYGSSNPQPATQFSTVNPTSSAVTDNGANAHFKLKRGRMGYAFAGTVPRYFIGDRILAPASLHAGTTDPVAAGFWRAKPVRPGEIFSNPDGSPLRDTAAIPCPMSEMMPVLAHRSRPSRMVPTKATTIASMPMRCSPPPRHRRNLVGIGLPSGQQRRRVAVPPRILYRVQCRSRAGAHDLLDRKIL